MSAPEGGVRTVVFADLDDTLFRTARKIPGPELARSVKAAHAHNGRHSFMTPRQQALLGWLDPARTVPVTARGSEAFSRVLLPFAGAAVVANGAAILDADGRPDAAWQAVTRRALAPWRATLEGLPARIREEAARRGARVRTWLVEEPGCGGVYAVVKSEDDPLGASLGALAPALAAGLAAGSVDGSVDGPDVPGHAATGAPARTVERAPERTAESVADGAVPAGWTVHLNGNNLALIPPGISKARAVLHLLERFRASGELLAIGVGDSASDLGFMRLCDLWMTPAGSQIDIGLPPGIAPRDPASDASSRPVAVDASPDGAVRPDDRSA